MGMKTLRQTKAAMSSFLRSDGLRGQVDVYLDLMAESVGRSDFKAFAAKFGAFLRRLRGDARLMLIESYMGAAGIEPTQTVAHHLMIMLFQRSADTSELSKRFAKSGRTASTKLMDDAMAAYEQNLELAAAYTKTYAWFLDSLDERVAVIKASRIPL